MRRESKRPTVLPASHDYRVPGNGDCARRGAILAFPITVVPAIVITLVAVIECSVLVRLDMFLPRIAQIGGGAAVRITGDIGIGIFLRLTGGRRRRAGRRHRRNGSCRRSSSGRGCLGRRGKDSRGGRSRIGRNIGRRQRSPQSQDQDSRCTHAVPASSN